MKFLILASLASLALAEVAPPRSQWYPLTRKGEIPQIKPYEVGQDVFIDCISRNIDNGEHKFDSENRIVYSAFPVCKETGKPFGFHYGVSENINCTVTFTDELYHLFQLYIHEDAPFSCRIPLSTEANYLEQGGAYVPLTFNFRGEIHDSHLDIDGHMNLALTKPPTSAPHQQTVVSAVAWSAGTNASRIVIGDDLTLEFAVRWLGNLKPMGSRALGSPSLPFPDGFYKLPMRSVPVSVTQFAFLLILTGVASAVVAYAAAVKFRKPGFMPVDRESSFAKQD